MLEITFHHVTAEVGQAVNRPVVVLQRTPQVLLRGKGERGKGCGAEAEGQEDWQLS